MGVHNSSLTLMCYFNIFSHIEIRTTFCNKSLTAAHCRTAGLSRIDKPQRMLVMGLNDSMAIRGSNFIIITDSNS